MQKLAKILPERVSSKFALRIRKVVEFVSCDSGSVGEVRRILRKQFVMIGGICKGEADTTL
jgi:hypothetical protein